MHKTNVTVAFALSLRLSDTKDSHYCCLINNLAFLFFHGKNYFEIRTGCKLIWLSGHIEYE